MGQMTMGQVEKIEESEKYEGEGEKYIMHGCGVM